MLSDPPSRHYLFFLSADALIIPVLDNSGRSTMTIECLSASKCFMISRAAMERSISNGEIDNSAVELNLVSMLERANHQLSNLLCRHGAARVAHLLVDLGSSSTQHMSDADGLPAIQLAQVELASALGISPVYLNQILKTMKEKGAVEVVSGKIYLSDMKILDNMSRQDGK